MNTLKRLWCTFMLVALSAISFTGLYVEAQSGSKLQKELEKQRTRVYKRLVRDYKKEGWKLANNNSTLEVGVLEHLTAFDDQAHNYTQTTGEVSKCKSANVVSLSVVYKAQNFIAQLMQGQIEGYVSSLVSADANNLYAEQ